MHVKTFLSVAALASTSLAQIATSTDAACLASLTQFSNAPTPAPALFSFLATAVGTGPLTAPGQSTPLPDLTLEDPAGYQALICSIAGELPQSLLPDFQSYASELVSYGSVHISQYVEYITDCVTTGEAASTLISELHNMLDGTGGACQTTAPATPTGSSNGTYPTGTGAVPTSTSSTSLLIPTAAAARPTGAVIGAAAIGGLLGAVALL
ncbi:hypothetical protein F5Y14DRAFT_358208 [Nemania sp. NC0429]|nr:hypothetical protein F5Y14DRAFT_358208 [Nemania sp. NC0429]